MEVARSVGEAAALAGEDAVLMGGAQLYRALLPRCERVLVTQVDAAAEGADAFFPNLDAGDGGGMAGGKRPALPLCRLRPKNVREQGLSARAEGPFQMQRKRV